jgi:protein-tyrosine phosphatase
MRTSRAATRTAVGLALSAGLLTAALPAQAATAAPAVAVVRAVQTQGPSLNLPDAPNARDIGGYRTWTGAAVRTGLVFR